MAEEPHRRMRSVSVAIGVTAVVAAALSGCTTSEDYEAVCVDEDTMERVSDYQCDDDYTGTYVWYYLGSGSRVPSVGSHVSGGSRTPPAGSSPRGGSSSYDSDSGSSSKYGDSSSDYGGFGGSSGGVSG